MTVIISTEVLTRELIVDLLPLAQKCWNESTSHKGESCAFYGQRDFNIEPDIEEYLKISQQGFMVLVTLRDEGNLVGYVMGYLYRSLHHKSFQCGMGDTMYIEPDYRFHTVFMVRRFVEEMKKLGVKIIGWPTTLEGPVYNILKSCGFVGDEVLMEKLCV